MLGYQVIVRLADGRPIAPSVPARRALARVVRTLGRTAGLLVFRLPDSHLHVVLLCSRERAGRFAHDLEVALRRRLCLPARFAPAHLVEIRDQPHLENVVDYVLRNQEHHGATADPLHDASNLPELLGLRVGGGWLVGAVREAVPRLRRRRLLEILGAPALTPVWDPAFAVDAAAAAVGHPSLAGKDPEVVAARAAVVWLWQGRQLDIAAALGVDVRTVRRHAASSPVPALEAAILGQIGLRHALAAVGPAEHLP
ncbi:MAG: hypothetical protein V4850_26685 [Myxococcota bacterium]